MKPPIIMNVQMTRVNTFCRFLTCSASMTISFFRTALEADPFEDGEATEMWFSLISGSGIGTDEVSNIFSTSGSSFSTAGDSLEMKVGLLPFTFSGKVASVEERGSDRLVGLGSGSVDVSSTTGFGVFGSDGACSLLLVTFS